MSPGSHYVSMPCIFRHFLSFGSPVSHRSQSMNHRWMVIFAGVLCPQWAIGATIWTTCMFGYFWAFLIYPQWAKGATIWTTCRATLMHIFWVPVSSGSHCISSSCTSAIPRLSGSPVSRRSQYINYTWMACKLSHCRPFWSPMIPESHYMKNL